MPNRAKYERRIAKSFVIKAQKLPKNVEHRIGTSSSIRCFCQIWILGLPVSTPNDICLKYLPKTHSRPKRLLFHLFVDFVCCKNLWQRLILSDLAGTCRHLPFIRQMCKKTVISWINSLITAYQCPRYSWRDQSKSFKISRLSETRCWNKKPPNFAQSCQKVVTAVTPTVAKYLGNFCKKKYSQDLSKISHFGHTDLGTHWKVTFRTC